MHGWRPKPLGTHTRVWVKMGLPRRLSGEELAAQTGNGAAAGSLAGWGREWLPTPGFLPWTEEPDLLQSMGSQRAGGDWARVGKYMYYAHVGVHDIWTFQHLTTQAFVALTTNYYVHVPLVMVLPWRPALRFSAYHSAWHGAGRQ